MSKSKEDQQQRVMPLEAFNLKKFKLSPDGGFVQFHEGGTDPGDNKKDCDYQPHPDLLNVLDELKPFMARRLGLVQGWDFAREAIKDDAESLQIAMSEYDACVERCKVNGVFVSGDNETKGIQITGSMKVPDGGSTGLAAPKITFGKEKLGYENEVESIFNRLRVEVYKYRFNGKKLQTSILDPDQEEN